MTDKFGKRDKKDGRRGDKKDRFGGKFARKRFCRYCADSDLRIDYKDGRAPMPFITERGKIIPRRITSTCAYHQGKVTTAIKRARQLALIPYTATQVKW
jgi:small subunit ribosomal protein S18